MFTLIHAPRSRSSSLLWLLEEAGRPYEVKEVSILRRDGSGAIDPANPHPHGKVPVLLHGDAVVFEQAAIALYVADATPEAKLGPAVGEKGRADFVSHLAYYSGVVEPAFVSKFLGYEVPRGTAGWRPAEEVVAYLARRLRDRDYLAGEAFTAADVLFASMFALFAGSPLAPKEPAIDAYVARCVARPAYARAASKEAPP